MGKPKTLEASIEAVRLWILGDKPITEDILDDLITVIDAAEQHSEQQANYFKPF